MKKNILVLIHSLNNGGVEAVMFSYLSRLNKKNVSIDLVAFEALSNDCYNRFKSITDNIYFVTPKRKGLRQYKKQMNSIMMKKHYDIIHSNLYEWSSIPLKIAKKNGIPIRISHTHIAFDKISFLNRITLFINSAIIKKYATHLVGCSKYACEFLYGKEKGIVLPNAFDFSKFTYDNSSREKIANKYSLSNKKFIIGNVGRLNYQKNHSFMIALAKELKERKIDACFLFVGCGELENSLKKLVEVQKLNDYVIFVGDVSDMKTYYSSFDLFCFPSLYEGLGLALVEAEISGLLCIKSEFVPEEAVISNRVFNMNLNDGVKIWVDKIEELMIYSKGINRINFNEFLLPNASIFDINKTIKIFKNIYEVED